MNKNEQIDRITKYETLMREAESLLRGGDSSAEALGRLRILTQELAAYYASDEWKQDFAADEAGLLPDDLKRGVLSEDGLYNLLEENREFLVEALLTMPYWVIDILPKQVPMESPGQFFAVEKYFLKEERLAEIKQKHINVILKLNCYRQIVLDGETAVNPSPEHVAEEVRRRYLYILVDDAMILSEPDDTHMTVFNPDEKLLKLIEPSAASEGLFVWRPAAQASAAEAEVKRNDRNE